jgi:hypothetical protein
MICESFPAQLTGFLSRDVRQQIDEENGPMFCPECGFDAGAAKFCPGCGCDLTTVRTSRTGAAAVHDDAHPVEPPSETAQPVPARRSPSTMLIWILAAVVVVAVIVAVFVVHDHGSSPGATPTVSAAASAPANPDLGGTFTTLVARGDGYYEKGAAYVTSDSFNFTAAAPWFRAAAKVLQAAWNKQPGDPALGTDLANALFYAGNTQGAISQIDTVLKKSPKDQEALLDKANFVNMAGQMDTQGGKTTQAKTEIAEAKQLYEEAIKIAPASASGKTAATDLKQL